MENKIGAFIGALVRFATPVAKKQIDRSQLIIKLKQKYPFLDDEHLLDDFGTVYARALFEYGLGNDLNILLLQLFNKEEVKKAFRTEFEQNDLSALEKEVEKLVNWQELDWNTLAEEIRNIEQEQNIKVDIHKEIEDFRKAFYKVLPRTLKPSQVHLERKLQELRNNLDKLENIDDILAELEQIRKLLHNQAPSDAFKQHNDKQLNPRIEETIKLYLTKSFNDDSFAELDQAGETDSERRTPLKQVFIDLDVKTRQGIEPRGLKLENLQEFSQKLQLSANSSSGEMDNLSAIACLLQECSYKVVIIGGPGQGKSTLGQQLAQIHRAKLLGKPYDFEPLVERIPFRVVLKDFAQRLADKLDSEEDDLETYLAEKVGKLAARPKSVSAQDIQEVFRCRPCLLILDGLDEVNVTELQKRMLSRIQDFIERAEVLGADIMVVATSRPNIYKNQFEPEQFWHLELQPLSEKKVQTYAEKWIQAQNLSEEKQARIIATLEECQHDRNISALLTTPLQVTIILLIIKDGGRPPSQREALFNEYWSTIFRREKSKANGIIQSEESILFNLHAYLGYLLHRRASEKNVQSLLPEEEFGQAISRFLRKEDQRSSEEAINAKMRTLLRDAQERLVLIVAPEPGLFGFELRSFQEFFAAVHLAQTATDTQQRFERLKAIACSQHWRNVALLFAGRIARNFRGEASNILELVCRVVDRGEPNRHLKPGAWLAIEIAADGGLSDNRDLQYNAVEYGLKVLETGLTNDQQTSLVFLTQRLSDEDKSDIFLPALEEKISSLPLSSLEVGLDIYAQHFGSNSFFKENLDCLIQTKRKDTVNSALNLALKYRATPSWIIERLTIHWSCWNKDISTIWLSSQAYTESLLNEWHLSETQATEIAKATYHKVRYYNLGYESQHSWVLLVPNTISEQLILMLRCISIVVYLRRQCYRYISDDYNTVLIPEINIKIIVARPQPLISIPNEFAAVLESLLSHSGIMNLCMVHLWVIFWYTNEPKYESVSTFFNCLKKNELISELGDRFWYDSGLLQNRPVLVRAFQYYKKEGEQLISKLLPLLDSKNQISITTALIETIRQLIEQSDHKQQQQVFIALITSIGLKDIFSQLIPLAEEININIDYLLDIYMNISYSFGSSHPNVEFPPEQIRHLLKTAEDAIEDSKKINRLLRVLTYFRLPNDTNLLRQLEQLLELVIIDWSNNSEFRTTQMIILFLKLLDYGNKPDSLLNILFAKIPQTELLQIPGRLLLDGISNWSSESLSVFKSFLVHKDEAVCVGTSLIIKALINLQYDNLPVRYREIYMDAIEELRRITLNVDMVWSYVNSDNSKHRVVGIALLSLSDDSIQIDTNRYRLLQLLQQPQNTNEEEALADFLKQIPISYEKHPIWLELLEQILGQPWSYTNLILNAAMEKYQMLTSPTGSSISEEQERALGLL